MAMELENDVEYLSEWPPPENSIGVACTGSSNSVEITPPPVKRIKGEFQP